ncbi:hypothetical protein B0A77_05975 [Flavobacterium branchiophilum]|uniref:Uncharacterized protein n=2 Tax=Flavobacterium branchiophilum TaxID=55197 RepID=A0A2H3KYX4_9FLAO|nr:hypothetical protein B0A77_05975 [Flavobacterium branchiophilum]
MKKMAKILLIFFLFFLITPTIISVIKKSVDCTYMDDLSEEKQVKKEAFIALFSEPFLPLLFHTFTKKKTQIKVSQTKHEQIYIAINIPPPELF